MPRLLAEARARTTAAFLAPQREAENRVAALRLQQREGLGDLLALGNGIDAIERELVPFIKHYQLDGGEGAGPRPLACAFQAVESTLATSTSRAAGAQGRLARANAVLLLGAALDGHGATGPLADVALLPVVSMVEAGLLSAVVNLAGQAGDLAESALKRGAGLKDSSTLLPGHGGLLDRVDSTLFALPVVYLKLYLSAGR